MEEHFREEKTMIKRKLIAILFFGICALLFVGVLNKSYEFYEPQLCLKYPTFKIFFVKPELPDDNDLSLEDNQNSQFQEYDEVYQLNQKLGASAEAIAYILVQFFISAVFLRWFKPYQMKFLIFDIILFFSSIMVFFVAFSIYNSNYLILLIIVFGYNFLVNYMLRNLIFNKVK
jgi:hypothetical protein